MKKIKKQITSKISVPKREHGSISETEKLELVSFFKYLLDWHVEEECKNIIDSKDP